MFSVLFYIKRKKKICNFFCSNKKETGRSHLLSQALNVDRTYANKYQNPSDYLRKSKLKYIVTRYLRYMILSG